jgi:adenine/guanine phosphoribosyltransferase-like PRPP-binding protein
VRFILEQADSAANIESFLKRNGVEVLGIGTTGKGVTLEVGDQGLTSAEAAAVRRNFTFYDLFEWVPAGMHDVLFWQKPERLEQVFAELAAFFPTDSFDAVASVEARGFILAGALAFHLEKPLIPVRKYREAYAGKGRRSSTYRNWQGYDESLVLLEESQHMDDSVLFVDDVLETGKSMSAAVDLLGHSMEVVGGFFLLDAAKPEVRNDFQFPVRSLLRRYGLLMNTAPAV